MQRSYQSTLFSSGIPLVLASASCQLLSRFFQEGFYRRLGMDKSVIPSPIVTDLEVAFLWDLYNGSFAPVTWDSLFVPNGVEQVSQDSCSCTEVDLQHFSMNGVYAWGFSTLHSFDGISNFRFCWGTSVDVEVIWHWWGLGGFIWLSVVQDFTDIFNPSISLFTFSCNSAAIFAFHRGRVSSVITTETFGDLVDNAQFTSCCSTHS